VGVGGMNGTLLVPHVHHRDSVLHTAIVDGSDVAAAKGIDGVYPSGLEYPSYRMPA
jgi:hypothetical protein